MPDLTPIRGPADLTRARRELAGHLLGERLDAGKIDEAVLLLSEACTNALLHPARGGARDVRVTWELAGDDLTIEVHDCGEGFTLPARPSVPDLWDTRGRGLFLMHKLADAISLAPRAGEGTTVAIRKRMATVG